MQVWKHQAMEGMETLGRPGVKISGGFGNTEKVRRGDTRQPTRQGEAWKHQAGVEKLSRRGDISSNSSGKSSNNCDTLPFRGSKHLAQ